MSAHHPRKRTSPQFSTCAFSTSHTAALGSHSAKRRSACLTERADIGNSLLHRERRPLLLKAYYQLYVRFTVSVTGLAACLIELHCPVTAMLADGAYRNIVNHWPLPCARRRSSVYKGSTTMFGKSESPENRQTKANGAAKEEQRQAAPMSQRGPVQHSTISADDRLTGNLISGGDITVEGTAEEDLARAADNYSTRIEQTLGMIETIEKNLREKRKRIEEIQTRHKDLALQYGQLGKSLDSATADLAQQFAGVITDLGNDGAISKLLAGGAFTTVFGSNLTPEKSELPPVPECVREIQDSSNEDEANLDSLQSAFIRKLKKPRRSNSKSAHRK